MSQIRRKPVRNSWQDSMPRPLSTNRALLQEFRGHVHRDMPHELHAMDHPALQNGVCESRTLTPEVDQPNNYHYPHYADDDGDADLGMATMRPSSPLDHEGMAAFNNMNSATTHVTWIPQQWYNYQETRPQIPVDEVTLAPVSGETSHTPASDVEALSAVSIPPPPPPSPPNGGTTAWLQVAGAFLLFFSSWGLVNTFGVFQEYYQQTYLSSFLPSAISWIGTMQGFLLIVVGVLSGPLYDQGHLRGLIGMGTALICLGLLIAGEVREYFGIFLSLSLLVGLGAGCLFVPSVAIVAQYFTTRRPFATGIAAAGGSFGGIIFPIVFKETLDGVGYGWACRILAFIVFASLIWPFLVMKPRTIPSQTRTLLDLGAFKDQSFTLFSLSLFFTFVGLYVPFFYLPSYSKSELGVNGSLTFYLLAVLNSGSVFGRLIPNLIAVYAGSLNILLFCIFTSGILVFFWIAIQDLAGVIAFAILYGFFSGAVVSLPPTALVTISPDLSKIGTRLGMSFSFAGFGLLVGNPIAGALLRSGLHYEGLQVFSGIAVIIGFVLLGCATMVHTAMKAKTEKGEK